MTAAGYIKQEVEKLLQDNRPDNIEQSLFALRRHNESYQRILENIKHTSISYEDEKARTEALCLEYGYGYNDCMLRYQKNSAQ